MRQRPYPGIVEQGRRESRRSARVLVALGLAGCAAGGSTISGSSATIGGTDDDSTTSAATTDDTTTTAETTSSSTSVDTSSSDEAGAETACEEVSWYPDMDGFMSAVNWASVPKSAIIESESNINDFKSAQSMVAYAPDPRLERTA